MREWGEMAMRKGAAQQFKREERKKKEKRLCKFYTMPQ
jgi:hypothetical protein